MRKIEIISFGAMQWKERTKTTKNYFFENLENFQFFRLNPSYRIHFGPVLIVKQDSYLIRYCFSLEILYDGHFQLRLIKIQKKKSVSLMLLTTCHSCHQHNLSPTVSVQHMSPILISGLLRTSTSSSSWIFEPFVPVPRVFTDVLVFVHGLSSW